LVVIQEGEALDNVKCVPSLKKIATPHGMVDMDKKPLCKNRQHFSPATTMVESFAAPPVKKQAALLPAATMKSFEGAVSDWLRPWRGVMLNWLWQLSILAAPIEKEAESPTWI